MNKGGLDHERFPVYPVIYRPDRAGFAFYHFGRVIPVYACGRSVFMRLYQRLFHVQRQEKGRV